MASGIETTLTALKIPGVTLVGGLFGAGLGLGVTYLSRRIITVSNPSGGSYEYRLTDEDKMVWKDLVVTSSVGVITLALAQPKLGAWQILGLAGVVLMGIALSQYVQTRVFDATGDIPDPSQISLVNWLGAGILAVGVICGLGQE